MARSHFQEIPLAPSGHRVTMEKSQMAGKYLATHSFEIDEYIPFISYPPPHAISPG